MVTAGQAFKIAVKNGRGTDRYGIERDFSEFVGVGTILQHEPTDKYPFEVWEIYDKDGILVGTKDWGRNEGAVVYPDRVVVHFGKTGRVEVGYVRRKDGTFYASVGEYFLDNAKRQKEVYKASRLYGLVQDIKECPEWNSLCYGIHLPDETKAAYKAAIDEAASGKYDFEFDREEI